MTSRNRLTITHVTPAYWRVSIDNPPINLYDPEMFAEINVLLDTLDTDKDVKVVVFESANPDYFVAHYDFNRADVMPDQPGAAEFTAWSRMVVRLAQSRVLSVAKIRGRARAEAQLWNSNHAFLGTQVWPETRARLVKLVEMGFMQPGDMEMNMGARLGREEDFRD